MNVALLRTDGWGLKECISLARKNLCIFQHIVSVIRGDTMRMHSRMAENENTEGFFYGTNISRPERNETWTRKGEELRWMAEKNVEISTLEKNIKKQNRKDDLSIKYFLVGYLLFIKNQDILSAEITTVSLINASDKAGGLVSAMTWGQETIHGQAPSLLWSESREFSITQTRIPNTYGTFKEDGKHKAIYFSNIAESFFSFIVSLDVFTLPGADAAPLKKMHYFFPEKQPEKCFTEAQIKKCDKVHKDKATKKILLLNLILKVGKLNCYCPPPSRINEYLSRARGMVVTENSISDVILDTYYYPENQSENCLSINQLAKCEKAHRDEEQKGRVFKSLRLDVGTTRCFCPPQERIPALRNKFSTPVNTVYADDHQTDADAATTLLYSKSMKITTTEATLFVENGCENNDVKLNTQYNHYSEVMTILTSTENSNYTDTNEIKQKYEIKYSKKHDLIETSISKDGEVIKTVDGLDISQLREFDHVCRAYYGMDILCFMQKKGWLKRDFYNKFLYPILQLAAEKLKNNGIVFNEENLMKETFARMLQLVKKFESMPTIHALRLDPLYRKLMFLAQQINNRGSYGLTFPGEAKSVYTNKLSEILKSEITIEELSILRIEALELIDFYQNPENQETEKFISLKLRKIMNAVDELFYEKRQFSTEKPDEKVILDALTANTYRLDKAVCLELKPTVRPTEPCTLFPDIGVAIFKMNGANYRKQYALLVAVKIFIPRLVTILSSTEIYTDTYELALLLRLYCLLGNNKKFCDDGKSTVKISKKNEADVIKSYTEGDRKSRLKQDAAALILGGASSIGALMIVNGILTEVRKAEQVRHLIDLERLSQEESFTDEVSETQVLPPSVDSPEKKGSVAQSELSEAAAPVQQLYFPEMPSPGEELDSIIIFEEMNKVARSELKGKKFIIKPGLNEEVSGPVPEYIAEAQSVIREGFDRVSEMIANLRHRIEVSLINSDVHYQSYLRSYFRDALAVNNSELIELVINRFIDIVRRVDEFLKDTVKQNYRNIFLISTEQTRTAEGGYASLLTEEERQGVSYAVTIHNQRPSVGIFTETSFSSPMHPGYYRRDLKSIEDTILHEATHAALTKDMYYLPRMANGKVPNAKDAYRGFLQSIEDMGTQTDLEMALIDYVNRFKIPYPKDIGMFFQEHPDFLAWIMINNADSALVHITSIARRVPYDAPIVL